MNNHETASKPDAGLTDLIGSMVGLASAGTKFTIRQMQNAITVFTDSQSVLNEVRDSLDDISKAMAKPPADATIAATEATEPRSAEKVFTGRKL
jgi:hypothetical protein